jgi:hypothetical protein
MTKRRRDEGDESEEWTKDDEVMKSREVMKGTKGNM